MDYVLCRTERKYTDGRTMLQPLEGVKEGVVEPPLLGLIWLKNFFYLQGPGAIVAKTEVIKKLGGFHSSTTGEDAFYLLNLVFSIVDITTIKCIIFILDMSILQFH
ncbi:hypothetical protein H9X57_06650 [Flavobacterium piscinae]|uniref:hypothetical protein n=1 Tax=Flavobacterium piscinae TaxID=2506424 RepID=UPI0019B95CA9|nr:hypothetical protein [Flavobacterium piscinae]MBC8883202.1 hypothetical protein [Flavobacterium piscinae]